MDLNGSNWMEMGQIGSQWVKASLNGKNGYLNGSIHLNLDAYGLIDSNVSKWVNTSQLGCLWVNRLKGVQIGQNNSEWVKTSVFSQNGSSTSQIGQKGSKWVQIITIPFMALRWPRKLDRDRETMDHGRVS